MIWLLNKPGVDSSGPQAMRWLLSPPPQCPGLGYRTLSPAFALVPSCFLGQGRWQIRSYLNTCLNSFNNCLWFLPYPRWCRSRESACQCRRHKRCDPLEEEPTPVFLPGKSLGQQSLAGYSLWGCKESDTTEQLTRGWLSGDLDAKLNVLVIH